jgi:HD domain
MRGGRRSRAKARKMKHIRPMKASNIVEFWGKASPANREGPSVHSIVYHSLDVAAVGSEFPARAGMNRLGTQIHTRCHCVSRTRGDEPCAASVSRAHCGRSPHARG